MKIFNLVKTEAKDWKILGGKLATRIVKDADKGISQDGKGTSRDFESYSYNYAVKKSTGKAGKKGVSTDRQTSPPNLRLTGKMLDSIKAQNATKTSVEILYADGLKVMGHAKEQRNKPKRNIYGLNDKNQQFVEDYLENKIENNILRFVAKDIEIDLNI
jgi:ABC-type uncharacterized transport system substrate-binding protein|tara:strand:- start:13 stop:489 length:477 start_codon:yes stop_codon:yes gene_type:complete